MSIVIAVDGTAASGKGTLAKKLAAHFGFAHLDSGALYRLTALSVLDKNGDPSNETDALKGAQTIDFTPAYCEIESTYLVPAGSPIQTIADVDKPGVRIAVTARAAYDLWLERNIRHAKLVRATGLDGAYDLFVGDKLEALAGLRPRLLSDVLKLPGARILDGQFAAVQQAVGTTKGNAAGLAFLETFVAEAKAAGLIAALIARHKVVGLSVAP